MQRVLFGVSLMNIVRLIGGDEGGALRGGHECFIGRAEKRGRGKRGKSCKFDGKFVSLQR